MMKILKLLIIIAVLTNSVWTGWAILKHAGLLWALFFGGFIFLPWGATAALAFLPRGSLRCER
jgi:hypothetical protein